MKKLLLAVAIIFIVISTKGVFAQQNVVSASIQAKGTVISHLAVQGLRNLDFVSKEYGEIKLMEQKKSFWSKVYE